MAFLLENSGLRIEVCNPNETADSHLHTRFSHCGYITQIIQKSPTSRYSVNLQRYFIHFTAVAFRMSSRYRWAMKKRRAANAFENRCRRGDKNQRQALFKLGRAPGHAKAHTEVLRSPDSLTFIQMAELAHIGYHYTKGIALNGSKLVVTHALKIQAMTDGTRSGILMCFCRLKNSSRRPFCK